MVSPLSPVVAYIFMQAFETVVLESSTLNPKAWFRNVDDTFIVWSHGRNIIDSFLNLYQRHVDIKCTVSEPDNFQI